jgi:hypothetical protein
MKSKRNTMRFEQLMHGTIIGPSRHADMDPEAE